MSFVVMVAGASATMTQHYGTPAIVGGLLIVSLSLITVLRGLSRIVEIVGIWLPFDKLVNIVYVINGYLGGILLVIMCYKSISRRLKKKTVILIKDTEKRVGQ